MTKILCNQACSSIEIDLQVSDEQYFIYDTLGYWREVEDLTDAIQDYLDGGMRALKVALEEKFGNIISVRIDS